MNDSWSDRLLVPRDEFCGRLVTDNSFFVDATLVSRTPRFHGNFLALWCRCLRWKFWALLFYAVGKPYYLFFFFIERRNPTYEPYFSSLDLFEIALPVVRLTLFTCRQNGRICCTKSRYERHFKNCHGTRQRKSQTDVLSQLCEDGNPTQRIPFATIDGLSQLSFADWSRNRCSVSNGRIVQSRWAFGEGVFSRWRLRRWK